ncbi:hypothetical protein LQ567_13530 [Niabella pedocola]|uniref:CBU-0592-like domain-containing protein n=1 Tax=Niabella pedocola TaxID=1752077 RepID=A0ABS8PRT1_9BACT|nr:hypothetical protein [Niabella pedocola]MCD2423791.1 hypothetical protein [Niabella pedocola]
MLHFFLFLSGDKMSSVMGWVGSIAYLVAYLFLSLNRLKAGRPLYHLLNMVGALGLIIHAVNLEDYPNLVVNLAWGIIAVTAVIFILRKKPEQKS